MAANPAKRGSKFENHPNEVKRNDLTRNVAGLEQRFNESRAELQEARAQRDAITEVLQIINSSPGNLVPVFDCILEKAHSLCGAPCGSLQLYERNGVVPVAIRGMTHAFGEFLRRGYPVTDGIREGLMAGHPVQRADMGEIVRIQPDEPSLRAAVELGGIRTMLTVPLMKNGVTFGRFVAGRKEVRLFSDTQIALLQGFAAQAAIAIENARLFNETKEALERQTATADILRVIASSPSALQPVFDAIAERSNRLLGGHATAVYRFVNDEVQLEAFTSVSMEADAALKASYPRPIYGETQFDRVRGGNIVQIADAYSEDVAPITRDTARTRGWRAIIFAPLSGDAGPIGAISVTRREPGAFALHQVELLRTFADQAVIAIQNARQFNETKEALERQTATTDILKVIASSPSDLQPVFEAIAERSNQLVDALSTTVFMLADGMMHLRAFTSTTPEADATLHAAFPAPLSTFSWNKSIRRGEIYRVIDSEHEPEGLRDLARSRGWRSCLCVPLLRDGKPIGMIGPTRAEPGPFTDHHVQLLQTFADQAVIAISNVGLFNEVQERTRELSKSLDDLRAAQDRLVQTEKLASLGQLTAGIAHEIKNPLNFVNNFSALSAELIDELDDTLAPAPFDQKMRGEVGELTQMLRSNLEKVVQHGKRANSIVRNMLLHSREGSGEHRSADINALVEESLNLAYHGARAEKPGFNVMLKRDLDPDAGAVELYPQEITRALLNLISNGFYAATQRKSMEEETFEPVLIAATKNLGKTVEIRIRDNGTGIPHEVKEKIFNPFFTTKPSGEGTGLGLSMSHDIIVKQHGGSIDVETEPGRFTEFKILLPRTSQR